MAFVSFMFYNYIVVQLYILLFAQLIVAENFNDRIAEIEGKCETQKLALSLRLPKLTSHCYVGKNEDQNFICWRTWEIKLEKLRVLHLWFILPIIVMSTTFGDSEQH